MKRYLPSFLSVVIPMLVLLCGAAMAAPSSPLTDTAGPRLGRSTAKRTHKVKTPKPPKPHKAKF